MTYLAATVREPSIELWHIPEHMSEPLAATPGTGTASASVEKQGPAATSSMQSRTHAAQAEFPPIAQELRDLEKRRMQEALAATSGVINQAARLIQMPERTFFKRMKEYALTSI